MQKKHLIFTAIISAVALGGLAFIFSQTTLFQGNFGLPDRGIIDSPEPGDNPVWGGGGYAPVVVDVDDEEKFPDLKPGEVFIPPVDDNPPAPPRTVCGTIEVSVQDQAGNFIRDLKEENLVVLDEDQNEIQYAMDPCPLGIEEYAPDFYQINLPVGQEYYLGFGSSHHVMEVSKQSAIPMEDARLAERLELILPYSFVISLQTTDGVALTADARVEANGEICTHLSTAFAEDQNAYGCPVSIYDTSIAYSVNLPGYETLEASTNNPRDSFWDPSFTVIASLQGGRPIAYVDVLDENNTSISNLDESHFSIENDSINSVIELPSGVYQLELNELGQNKALTVSVEEYENLTQNIRAWSTPTEAQNNLYIFSLNKKSAQEEKVCDTLNLSASSINIKASEAPKSITLTLTGTSKNKSSLLTIIPHWLAQAFHFEGPEAILASEEDWSGTLRLRTTGNGVFSENDLLVHGESYTQTLTYTASPGDRVSAEIVGEECSDSIFFGTEAEVTESTPVAPAPEATPTSEVSVPQNAYLVVQVENQAKTLIKNLNEDDFKLTGPNNTPEDFNEIDDGIYEFTLEEGAYDLTLSVTGYAKASLNDAETFSTRSSAEQNNYTMRLQTLNLLTDENYKCEEHFRDITDELICRMRDAGIIEGVGGGYFGLTTITEAEALKTMLASRGYDEADGRALPAVPSSVIGYKTGWYDAWYRIAVNQNIIRDFADPNNPIPRERYAVLAARTWKKELRGFDQSDIPFTDVKTSDSFAYAVVLMNQTEVDVPGEGKTPIIEGYSDETFRPRQAISRKDAIYMLYRILLAWENELPLETEGLSF